MAAGQGKDWEQWRGLRLAPSRTGEKGILLHPGHPMVGEGIFLPLCSMETRPVLLAAMVGGATQELDSGNPAP